MNFRDGKDGLNQVENASHPSGSENKNLKCMSVRLKARFYCSAKLDSWRTNLGKVKTERLVQQRCETAKTGMGKHSTFV